MPTSFTYINGVPNPPDLPSQDVGDMQTNTNSTRSFLTVDHVDFGSNLNGYHKIIHQPNLIPIGGQTVWNPILGSGVPAAVSAAKIANVNQLFVMNYTPTYSGATSDTQLFSMTAGGGISQLTGNNTAGTLPGSPPLNNTEGWSWLGGILMQWGFVSQSTAGTSNTITFSSRYPSGIAFPNKCFNVSCTPVTSGSVSVSTNLTTVYVYSVTNTSFGYSLNGATGKLIGFYWTAIGN